MEHLIVSSAAVYMTGALLTFGRFYRHRQFVMPRRHYIYSALWPVWWPLTQGISGMLDAIGDLMWGSEQRVIISFAIGLFTSGYYLALNWSSCSGFVTCTGVAMKSTAMLFAPISAFYWGWMALG